VLEITRVFDAPRSLVFKAWTDPAHAVRWMGPRGFTATHFKQDARPGSRWRACLRRDEDGAELWQGGILREAVPPERLVFSFAWNQEDGHPGHETLVTVSFAEDGDGTRMTFRQAVFASVASRDGHGGGWSSAFERLNEFLAQACAAAHKGA
jgi:uncharacterized protein YndB with AHSA1/START domain